MKWKLVIAVIVILGIVGLLFVGSSATNYLNFLKDKIGEFARVILKQAPSEKQFFIMLTTNEEMFYGQAYKVSNSAFEGSGTAKEVKINNAASPVNEVNIKIEGMEGTFEMTKQKTAKISADAARVILNDLPILNLNIYVEMVPSSFSLSFNQDKLTLSSVNGQVRTQEGWTKELSDAYVDLYGFKGSLKLEGEQVVLEGVANKLVVDGKEVTIS
jgi:outer membrane murein-binding lipoprotein Lpp